MAAEHSPSKPNRTAVNTHTPEMLKRLDEVKWDMINEWAVTRKAPQHARWMHDGSAPA